MAQQATELLVDSHHGVFAAQTLVKNFLPNLYVNIPGDPEALNINGKLYSGLQWIIENVLDNETADSVFDPYNAQCNDNIDWLMGMWGIYVKTNVGNLWRVGFNDGDIIAIHPDAHWVDSMDMYMLGEKA